MINQVPNLLLSQVLSTVSTSSGIFFSIALGYYFQKSKKTPAETSNVLSFVLFKIVVPILIFNILYGIKFSANDLPIFLTIIIFDVLLIFISFLIAKLLKFSKEKTGTLILCMLGFSVGVIGYP